MTVIPNFEVIFRQESAFGDCQSLTDVVIRHFPLVWVIFESCSVQNVLQVSSCY